jgi:hypothetical protein
MHWNLALMEVAVIEAAEKALKMHPRAFWARFGPDSTIWLFTPSRHHQHQTLAWQEMPSGIYNGASSRCAWLQRAGRGACKALLGARHLPRAQPLWRECMLHLLTGQLHFSCMCVAIAFDLLTTAMRGPVDAGPHHASLQVIALPYHVRQLVTFTKSCQRTEDSNSGVLHGLL